MKHWLLVVEDEKDLRDILVEEFTKEGFSLLSCSKVVDAIRFLSNQKFSCILLDMRLEKGNGAQILASIRRDHRNQNFATPVLVISGELNVDLVRQIRGTVSGVFVKPFKLSALLTKVKSVCLSGT